MNVEKLVAMNTVKLEGKLKNNIMLKIDKIFTIR